MQHKGTQTLKTSKLTLRRFLKNDVDIVHRNWFTDSDTTKFLTWQAHSSIEHSATIVNGWIEEYNKADFYHWAIVLDDIKEPIGSIAVVRASEEIMEASIGYCIGHKWWHQGIMSEALSAVIKYLFLEVGYNRIVATHDINNPNSGRVMQKCGMQYEGTLRQAAINNQGIADIKTYAILREDYLKDNKWL